MGISKELATEIRDKMIDEIDTCIKLILVGRVVHGKVMHYYDKRIIKAAMSIKYMNNIIGDHVVYKYNRN